MFNKLIKVDVVSRKGTMYSAKAKIINLRGDEGDMGISYGHTQLLSTLPEGVLNIKCEKGQPDILYISGGIAEIGPKQVIILTDNIKFAKDIDEITTHQYQKKAYTLLDEMNKIKDKAGIKKARRMISESEACLKAVKIMKNSPYYSSN